MKVLIEGTQAFRRHVGWGRYNKELVWALSRAAPGDELWVFYSCPNRDDADFARSIAAPNVKLCPLYLSEEKFTRIEESSRSSFLDAEFRGADVYHAVTEYPWYTRRIPLVATIHELTPLVIPASYSRTAVRNFRSNIARSVRRAEALVAVSENTRRDLTRLFPRASRKTHVIVNGVSREFAAAAAEPRPSPMGVTPYLLYVGAVTKKAKNFRRFVHAYAAIAVPEHLVVVTKQHTAQSLCDAFDVPSSARPRIHVRADVSDEELRALYENAKLYVYPSTYEGFGLPVVEAMSVRCPVLCARGSSLDEVAGDACLRFDPHDPEDLGRKLLEGLRSYPAERLDRARDRVASRYSWDRAAKQYLALYGSSALAARERPWWRRALRRIPGLRAVV